MDIQYISKLITYRPTADTIITYCSIAGLKEIVKSIIFQLSFQKTIKHCHDFDMHKINK